MTCTSRVYMTQASTPKWWSQIVTHEKENMKQSNANPMLQCLWCILEIYDFTYVFKRAIMKQKLGRNITQSAVIKARNYRVD